jgi:hypothetical protein
LQFNFLKLNTEISSPQNTKIDKSRRWEFFGRNFMFNNKNTIKTREMHVFNPSLKLHTFIFRIFLSNLHVWHFSVHIKIPALMMGRRCGGGGVVVVGFCRSMVVAGGCGAGCWPAIMSVFSLFYFFFCLL